MKIKITFLIIGLIGFLSVNGQISGDWILSHYYVPNYDSGFDMTRKKIEMPMVMTFTNDSIKSVVIKRGQKKETGFTYKVSGDSLAFGQGRGKQLFKIIKDSDTLCIIDEVRKGSYFVLREVQKSKLSKITTDKIADLITDSRYAVDFKALIPMQKPYDGNVPNDNLIQFNESGKMLLDDKETFNWMIISTDNNTYLVLDYLIYQIVRIDKKSIILAGHYLNGRKEFKLKVIKN